MYEMIAAFIATRGCCRNRTDNSPGMEDQFYENNARTLPLAVSVLARFLRGSTSVHKSSRNSEKNRQGHQGGNRAKAERHKTQARMLCGVLGPGYCDNSGTAGLLHGTCTPKSVAFHATPDAARRMPSSITGMRWHCGRITEPY